MIRRIDWDSLSRHRTALMGIAMLAIMLFHVGNPRADMFYGLRRCGNVGVDMFLFLSGIGLWFSWNKRPDWRHFFRNRYWRVYPSWLIVASLYYIPRYLGQDWHTKDLTDLVLNILFNWSFWRSADLAFWYVPATMMLYCFAPTYMNLIKRYPSVKWMPVFMMVWCVMVQWVAPIHQSVGHLEIFWSRIPIFLLGINCGEAVRQRQQGDAASLWMLLLVFILSFSTCIYLEQQLHGRFPLFIERMVYIPFSISGLLLLGWLLDTVPQWSKQALSVVGTISLEIYLIHLHFIEMPVLKWRMGYWGTVIVVIILSLPLSWLLYQFVLMSRKCVTKALETREHKGSDEAEPPHRQDATPHQEGENHSSNKD